MRILILGGSGFLSGHVRRAAVAAGHAVQVVTRGQKPLPAGADAIAADRTGRAAFAAALDGHGPWDLVVDCIAFTPDDAEQDLDVFTGRCGRLVFISTDFVYHPDHRRQPQAEAPATYAEQGYGANKRDAERVLIDAGCDALAWTVLRPGHIYGPGRALGCLPRHARDEALIDRLRRGEALKLIGGGELIQQPVYAPDLARTILSAPDAPGAVGKVLNVANPDVIASREYYEHIADILGVAVRIEAVDTESHLAEHPEQLPFCRDRVYDLSALHAAGLSVPATPIDQALRQTLIEEGVVAG